VSPTLDTQGWERPLTRAMRADGRPASLDEYLAAGGYEGLGRALRELQSPDVTTLVTESGLRGRGGAGYATGRTWSTRPRGPAAPAPKYVVCNADEMEPGSFKDRYLMTRNPHLLIEGMLLAGFATEATAGYIFLRAQYDEPRAALEKALAEAYERGFIGERLMDSDFSFDLYLHVSVGRYICGEASAALNAMESDRPNPRARPPHMTGAGLWARPTVVNNVESFCCVPSIVRNGVEWWKGLALTDEGGTKVYGVSGRVHRPGCYELPVGTTLRELIEVHAGGMLPGYELRALLPGGASTPFVAARDLDTPMDFDAMSKIGSGLGVGCPLVIDDQTCPVGITLNLMKFFAQESCGWCTPCREGLQWVVSLVEGFETGGAKLADLDLLGELMWVCGADKCFCDLAPAAMKPLEAAIRLFGDEFETHVTRGGCTYGPGGSHAPVMRGETWQT
jgi:NADH-quinone oxidoreductase subunit F